MNCSAVQFYTMSRDRRRTSTKLLAGSITLITMATLSVQRKGAFMHINTFTQQLTLSPQAGLESDLV